MEKHEYRGYEIAIQVERLASGRFVVDSRVTAKSDEERAHKSNTPWLGSKQLHSTSQEQAVSRALNSSKQRIDLLIANRSAIVSM
ncbi:hypothetical protein [Trinickia mobilis]|uniref:hypothetical protein n=1 Tax=Trinickia mobilis TaxID=2816356 RepID=UPI001A8EF2B7|nr:hypothetical protein [Trinickia mobilis]